MTLKTAWTAYGSTALFVLLWGSGAIFTRWGLDHASAFAFLTLRFAMASAVLLMLGVWRGRWLPARGTRLQIAMIGLVLIGSYSICYFLALDNGITPGVLATLLGAQPILTLAILEQRFTGMRLLGLTLALVGLVLVVFQSLVQARFSLLGMTFALGALISMTGGAILQKRIQQAPVDMLGLQYVMSLLLCLVFVPFQPFRIDWTIGFLLPLLWMGLVISVMAQLLLYRLIQAGNLVNVTSLFYLVPVVTAVMDYLFLGNALSGQSLLGMLAILAGVALVFRQPKIG